MSYFALINDAGEIVKYPISPRAEFPNVSFGLPISGANLPPDCVEVFETPMPEGAEEGWPQNIDGVWLQTWIEPPQVTE